MEVWHVRHGERCDEIPRGSAERSAWRRSAVYREGRFYDPPLTEHGHVQASAAGLYLKSLSFNQDSERDRAGFDRVYTSPLMRAAQTAVCLARELGGLPLQVVPGLCSCTAALARIGFDQATLMTDADILATFPGVDLLPRDPLAPTSFRGAVAWLAGRSPDRRVLSVGHREGTKTLAGRSVPTPHCCIGIFRVDRARKRYTMHDLLSHEGHSLGSRDCSTYAKPRLPAAEATSSVGSRMATLTLASNTKPNGRQKGKQNGKLNGKPTREPAHSRRANSGDGLLVRGERRAEDDLQRRASTGGAKSNGFSTRGADGRSWRDKWSSRISRTSRGAGTSNGASGASGKALGSAKRVPLKTSVKAGVKQTGFAAERGGHRDGVPDIAAGSRAAPSPRSKDNRARLTPENNGGGGGGMHGPPGGKLLVERADSCAGRGFRAAALSRRSVGHGSALPGILRVPRDTLCGPAGVLSYLHPTDLCAAQVTCKSMTTAAESEDLWAALCFSLPDSLIYRCEEELATAAHAGNSVTEGRAYPKALFATAVSLTLFRRAWDFAHLVATIRRLDGVIDNQRHLVTSLDAPLAVRIDGVPTSIVDTRGTRREAWVLNTNVLSEVTFYKGVRSFTLSCSTKVEVPPGLTAPSHLRSLTVACSLPIPWLPRVAVASADRPLFPGARLLGKSADGAVALYDVFDRNCGGGAPAALPPRPRGCALLGVLEGHPAGGKDSSGIGFLTVHLPHEQLLYAGYQPPLDEQSPGGRRCQSYGDDAAGARHGLENFTLALGLRTAGVPVWEAAWPGAEGRLCSLLRESRRERSGSAEEDRAVVCFDLVRPGDAAAAELRAERTLRDGPGLPYTTSGGLSGVVENVLIADLAVFDAHRDSLWAFALPIVFEPSPVATAGSKDDCIIDMAHNEVREKRRRGFVDEPGVGRVTVELALVESSTSDEGDTPVRAPVRRRCPAGHEWIVRVARVDLELGFVNAWFGTNHASP